jgi:hypothetical protein
MERIRREFGKNPQELREQRYQDYLDGHGRYGKNIKLLQRAEFDSLADESGRYYERLAKGGKLKPREEKRHSELLQLTLAMVYLWDGLVPENPPSQKPQ